MCMGERVGVELANARMREGGNADVVECEHVCGSAGMLGIGNVGM